MLFRHLRYRSAKAGTDDVSSDFTVTAALAALLSMIASRRWKPLFPCGLAYM
jgi:hypothetical protein